MIDDASRGPQARISRTVVDDIGCLNQAERDALLELPKSTGGHAEALRRMPILNRIERGGAIMDGRKETSRPLRVVFWNAERLKHVAESASFLAALAADVILLAEVDIGMVRSGQNHTVRDLAAGLGMAYVYATEFVELGLGDAREREWFAGQQNRCGLHGGAILSRLPLLEPAMIRLPETGDWFDGRRGERRVGGRIALTAQIDLSGTSVLVAALHLESHGSPDTRAQEIAFLLPALAECAKGAPIVLGGDFNTNTADRGVPDWHERRARLAADHPERLTAPESFEPMFDLMAKAGFDREACNAPGATQRTRPDGTPPPPFGKIDWLFCRDMMTQSPAIHPALARDGTTAISDHEAISVQISPPEPRSQTGRSA